MCSPKRRIHEQLAKEYVFPLMLGTGNQGYSRACGIEGKSSCSCGAVQVLTEVTNLKSPIETLLHQHFFSVQAAICNRQDAADDLHNATCSMQRAADNKPRATGGIAARIATPGLRHMLWSTRGSFGANAFERPYQLCVQEAVAVLEEKHGELAGRLASRVRSTRAVSLLALYHLPLRPNVIFGLMSL